MSPYFLPMPISHNLGGIKKSAFPEADHNLSCHRIPRGPIKLLSVPSCQLFVCSGLLQMSDACIHLSYFIYHVAVCLCLAWTFFSSQLLSNMLASIIYPCTCCSGESAACWSAANMGFCFSWNVLERERERSQEGNLGFLWAPWRLTVGASRGLLTMCMCWHSSHLPSSVGFWGGKTVQCRRVLPLTLLASLQQGKAQLCFLLVWEIWNCL